MFHKVTVNTELVDPEHYSEGKYRARFLQASAPSIVVNQSVRNLVLCVFLFKYTLFNIQLIH